MYESAETTAYRVSLGEALNCALILMLLIGIVFAFLGKRRLSDGSSFVGWFALIWGGLVATTSALLIAYFVSQYFRYAEALRTGSVDVVDGRVHVVRAQVGNRGPGDLIEVAGHRFVLGNDLTPGYTLAIDNGGMLTEGRAVRLFVFEGRIVRIDLISTDLSPVSFDDPARYGTGNRG